MTSTNSSELSYFTNNSELTNLYPQNEPRLSSTKSVNKVVRKALNEISEMISNLKEQSNFSNIDKPSSPILEATLFVGVGLFVLMAMNLMLNLGKKQVQYKFSI